MRVLMVHNAYQQRGGEDTVFEAEVQLLRNWGSEVHTYLVDNDGIAKMRQTRLAAGTIWSSGSRRTLRDVLRESKPDVAHFHNTFPLISPAGYAACRDEGVPVVQTLHNYRLLCPNGLFFREGRVCEDCLGKTLPWPGVAHACYRESPAASAVVATMLTVHRTLRTWAEKVDVYIALTEFARKKFIEGGLPPEKIVVKPNFVHPDPGPGEGRGGYVLFVGRLSSEKGIETLLAAWELLESGIPLKVVGDGPLADLVSGAAGRISDVEWLGRRTVGEVRELMSEAAMLVFPSEWYEGFPMVIAEAYAAGLPVLGGDLGGVASLIDPGRTGLHFRPGDPEDLAGWVEKAFSRPAELAHMRRGARTEFEAGYTAERNYRMLTDVYRSAISRAEARV